MQRLETDQMREMLDSGDQAVVINVLNEEQYRAAHIPRSINIPLSDNDFVRKVEEAAGGRDRPVVVYCASTECNASPTAARKLEDAGFSRVYDYEGGTKAWQEAGLRVERSAA